VNFKSASRPFDFWKFDLISSMANSYGYFNMLALTYVYDNIRYENLEDRACGS
jgi:hypothetical protein